MNVLFYSIKDFERSYLSMANTGGLSISMRREALSLQTASLAKGYDAISIFAGDDAFGPVLEQLFQNGVRYVAVRSAGYDNVSLETASALGIQVANVPAYSPYAIAEHAVALMLALNRKLIIADKTTHRHDFRVDELVGFDMHGKTVGIIGTGRIGMALASILHGFGCHLLAYDIKHEIEWFARYDMQYTNLYTLCQESDIVSLHVPLNEGTHHMVNKKLIGQMKPGVMIINTSRGACIDTNDVIEALDSGKIGYLGIDVYEEEKGKFFYDWEGHTLDDPLLEKLLALPQVIVTPHQAFATHEALTNIATTTIQNMICWVENRISPNELTVLRENESRPEKNLVNY